MEGPPDIGPPESPLSSVALLRPGRFDRAAVLIVIAAAVAVTLAYFGLARLSLLFILKEQNIAAIWPANGLILGILMVTRRRQWPIWLLCTMIGSTAGNLFTSRTLAAALAFSAVNTGEICFAGILLRRTFPAGLRFTTVREVLGFVLLGCMLGSGVAAIAGACIVKLESGGLSSFWDAWRLWTVVDALGLLVITPAVVTFWEFRSVVYALARKLEAGLLFGLFVIVCFFIFSNPEAHRSLLFNFPYVTLLPFFTLGWASF